MGSKYTKRYSDEYKRDAIELVRSSGRTVTEAARQLDVSAESLRAWVKKAKAAEAAETGGSAASLGGGDERDEELKRLRKLTVEQAKTIEILKKRRPSSRRRAIGERDMPVHPCGEGELHDRSAVPGDEDCPLHL
ncbi:transposase, partial [Streptomyces sp. NPDC056480]|uniref:transposase n=1 Tax=Streptomyces sp. NPDC056480 TaxID=3345833 RepID=UPI0036771E0A